MCIRDRFTSGNQGFYKQGVELVGRIEDVYKIQGLYREYNLENGELR